jgi:L-threonylcarbamoyladenylate synthase
LVAAAVAALRRGGLVAFPTETVYGLGADAANPDALARLYRVKGRPHDHPVIVHVARAGALDTVAVDVPDVARRLAAEFWPGPLTLVVVKRPGAVHDAATGGRPTVGVRVPDHPVALDLLDAFGGGIAAPSANRYGRVSPTTAAHVRTDLGDEVDIVLDGGPARVGVESTIVDVTGAVPRILRVGGIDEPAIARVAGAPVARVDSGEIAAPGTKESHYAPDASIELVDARDVDARAEAHLARGERVGLIAMMPLPDVPDDVTIVTSPRDVDEYARVLYAALRDADAAGISTLLVVPPPATGVGVAVGDRLRRASTDRTVDRL